MVLLCFSLLCRKRAKSDEIGRKSDKWQNSGVHDASRTMPKRVASTPVATLWRDSHCLQFTPLHASRVHLMRVASLHCRQAQKGPIEGPSFWKVYLRRSSLRSEEILISTNFPSQRQSFESREQEKKASIGEGLERKQEVKIERSSRIASILRAWSCLVLSFSLLFSFSPCMSRSSSF